MDDLISRADAIDVLIETIAPPSITLDTLVMRIDDIPSAQPKQGEWIAVTKDDLSRWECSLCGKPALLDNNEQMELSKFCPHCGARLQTERSE